MVAADIENEVPKYKLKIPMKKINILRNKLKKIIKSILDFALLKTTNENSVKIKRMTKLPTNALNSP